MLMVPMGASGEKPRAAHQAAPEGAIVAVKSLSRLTTNGY
jgi:hypothetical protein